MNRAPPQGSLRIEGPAALRRRRLLKFAFWFYALLLFTGTHWPHLHAPGPEGTDKFIHIGAFGAWMLIAALQGWFGPPLSDRNLLRTLFVAAAYGGADEGLQAIPFVHRTCALDDYAANAIGVMLAALFLVTCRRAIERRVAAGADQTP
jgi:hypothetical protein